MNGKFYMWKKRLAFLLPAVMLFFAGIRMPGAATALAEGTEQTDAATVNDVQEEAPKKKLKNGWVKKNGKLYYYEQGVKQTGWKKVKGKYYFMNNKGVCQTNKIAGCKKAYYYVDASGARIDTKEMNYAVKFIRANTGSAWSSEKKLKECFRVLADKNKYSYQRFYMNGQPKAKDMPGYAKYMFKNKKGNCYRYAAVYAYIAKALGYDARVAVGWVSRESTDGRTPHGWTEVKFGEAWYVCDSNMQTHIGEPYFYYKQGVHPCEVWVYQRYTLKTDKGKVRWK